MWAALLGFLQALPKLLDLIQGLTNAIKEHTAELQEARIAKAQKDMNLAQTPDEIKKAADEQAQALRHL